MENQHFRVYRLKIEMYVLKQFLLCFAFFSYYVTPLGGLIGNHSKTYVLLRFAMLSYVRLCFSPVRSAPTPAMQATRQKRL